MEKQITQTVILLFTLCHQWNECGRLQFLVQKQSHKNCRFERSKILQKFSYNHLGKKNSNEALQIHLISYFFLHIYFLWGSFSLPFFFFFEVNSIMWSSFHCLSFNISCCNEMTWFSKCGLYLSGLQSYHIFSLARLVTIAFLPCPPLLYIVLQGFKVLSRQWENRKHNLNNQKGFFRVKM